ncbi:MAG: DUF177 domain-containing protein [Arcicella sp.]|nr:DUF177 domain-containing protein [Arcicella sp.]
MQKSILNTFKIDIFRLESKQYMHEFEGNDDFFEALDQNLIQKGHFKATVSLNKNETMIQMIYKISGNVELTCDRSLDLFDFSVDITQKMILKFSDHNEEITEELMLIDRNTQYINVAQDIFDFIGLQIPIKKLHPRFTQDEVTYDSLMQKFEEEYEEEDFDEDNLDDDDFDFGDDENDNFESNDEESEDEGEIVYSTLKDVESESSETEISIEKPIDPRWEALMKLNKN